jgi:hypothetical protein
MKIWVPKQREVTVEVIEKDNPDTDLKAGDLAVTMDGRTRIYSPDEFAERFEEKKVHEWPGYINVQSPDGRYDSGCLAIALTADSATGLAAKLNAWAEAPENRGYIIKHLQTSVDNSTAVATYSYTFLATTETTKEDREHLADVHNEVTKLLEERRAKKAADELDHLEKARELQAAAKVAEKVRIRELERLAEAGRKHEANCGKKGKK